MATGGDGPAQGLIAAPLRAGQPLAPRLPCVGHDLGGERGEGAGESIWRADLGVELTMFNKLIYSNTGFCK